MATKEKNSKERTPLKYALALGASVLALGGLVKIQEHRNPYGYDPANNRPAPTYLHTQEGIDPANNTIGDGSK